MNRKETMMKAWDEWHPDDIQYPQTASFEEGFNAAWDALLNEIRPLVADLRTHAEISGKTLTGEPWLAAARDDAKAIKRLRELTQDPT